MLKLYKYAEAKLEYFSVNLFLLKNVVNYADMHYLFLVPERNVGCFMMYPDALSQNIIHTSCFDFC